MSENPQKKPISQAINTWFPFLANIVMFGFIAALIIKNKDPSLSLIIPSLIIWIIADKLAQTANESQN